MPTRSGADPPAAVPFWTAFRFWLKLGLINFGGPTGQIAVMHQELVERRRWISEDRFLHALNYCMLLPGPEAQQLAVYVGWLLHRTPGGLIAGTLFVLPGALLMLALSWVYVVHGDLLWIAAIFYGLRAAVIAIVLSAMLRIARKALKNRIMLALAALAFVAIFFLHLPFPLIVLGAGALGLFGSRSAPRAFLIAPAHGTVPPAAVIDDLAPPGEHTRPRLARALGVVAIGGLLWWGPLALVITWRGSHDVLAQIALFFSKAAMVTFGGAYAVLAYINEAAVHTYGWMSAPAMLDGLGLAETTPGPLILVTEFVGFLGAYARAHDLSPTLAGCLGAAITLWATFAPCFLWIFLGAPFIEHLRGNVKLTAALSCITAAVVGVIANLSVWFALHALFARVTAEVVLGIAIPVPDLASLDWFALLLAAFAFAAMQRLRLGIMPVILICAGAGFARRRG
ncbi:MAG: chromate efflux transporter [Planctomycetota bacterium]